MEIKFSVAVRVKDADDARNERVILQLGKNGFELGHANCTGIIKIKLLESLAQPFYFVLTNYTHTFVYDTRRSVPDSIIYDKILRRIYSVE